MKRCHVARSASSIATSTLRPPTLLTRISIGGSLGEHAPAKILAPRGLGDVGGKGPGLAPAFAHFSGGPGEGVGIARDKDDVGAGFGSGERDLPPEPAAAARNEDALAVQSEAIEHGHVGIPWFLPVRSQ